LEITDFKQTNATCSDCFRSPTTNITCSAFFWFYCVFFVLIAFLVLEYCVSQRQPPARKKQQKWGFLQTLIFATVWSFCLILEFTGAYVNYPFRVQIYLQSLPILNTFIIIAIVIKNLLQIYGQLVKDYFCVSDVTVFKAVAIACCATQVLNPILASFERYNYTEVQAGLYEHNWEYYTRNSLTSAAALVLALYAVFTCVALSREFNKYDLYKRVVKTRVIKLSVLVVIVLVLRVTMIWSQNVFWYSQQPNNWLYFMVAYQVSANILPLSAFMYITIKQNSPKHEVKPRKITKRTSRQKRRQGRPLTMKNVSQFSKTFIL
jgi:hypothetical protein